MNKRSLKKLQLVVAAHYWWARHLLFGLGALNGQHQFGLVADGFHIVDGHVSELGF